ncbi:MAG TPA: MarR family winged helix-turn-helix transcriptional regulator [Acidimicrobiales bacterium]|nr:MarR family winged helix-turn-helix transcriptional regulator [Acidimicrobiales bacterium]
MTPSNSERPPEHELREPDEPQQPPLSVLLRNARRAVADHVRLALDEAGFADLPPNGPFVLSALAFGQAPHSEVISRLGVSKQAAGQLVETLVGRGYLERFPDPADGRRFTLALTVRGERAGTVVRSAAAQLEAAVEDIAGADGLRTAKQVLEAVIEMGAMDE